MVLTEGCKRWARNVIYFCALFCYKNLQTLIICVSQQGKKNSYCSPHGCSFSASLFFLCLASVSSSRPVLERMQSSDLWHLAALQPGVSRADLQSEYTFSIGAWFKIGALSLAWCQRQTRTVAHFNHAMSGSA